jgi:hypothetical protein
MRWILLLVIGFALTVSGCDSKGVSMPTKTADVPKEGPRADGPGGSNSGGPMDISK